MNHIWLNDCAICLRKLKRNKISTKCQHSFHGKCLQEWTKRSRACPLCRANVNVKEILIRNIHNTKDQLVTAIKNFEYQFEQIDYRYIRMNFPMYLFSNEHRKLMENNKYIIAIMWALLYDTKNQFRSLKSSFITLIQAYTKLQNQLQNKKPSLLAEINRSIENINIHRRSIQFWRTIYPFNMFEGESFYDKNGHMVVPDYAFMTRIVKALQLHKQDEKLFNSYVKFLKSERKTQRGLLMKKL